MLLAYGFTGLALIGVFVPGLPTTPFVLLAAWAASRGSPRLHDWLYDHPRLGPALRHWRDQRAVSTRGRLLAVGLLAMSWTIMYLRGIPPMMLAAVTLLFVAVGTFVVTRPRPRQTAIDSATRTDRSKTDRG